jgi:hypothetical protein
MQNDTFNRCNFVFLKTHFRNEKNHEMDAHRFG